MNGSNVLSLTERLLNKEIISSPGVLYGIMDEEVTVEKVYCKIIKHLVKWKTCRFTAQNSDNFHFMEANENDEKML